MKALPARLNNKPQYVFHPTRAIRRALRRAPVSGEAGDRAVAHLPWGLTLEVYMSDAIGYSIVTGGVFDPCVSETLHRMIDPGDVVVDVGANVGYLTSLAAARAGDGGVVIAYEPHPSVFELLAKNVARWASEAPAASVEIHQEAMSDRTGVGELVAGPVFHANMGLASLSAAGQESAGQNTVTVPLRRLDDAIEGRAVGLLKIDVEGHEPGVLRGARALLERGSVRDIVFEDHDPYPSEATEIVEACGYRLISLENDLLGLRLRAPYQRGVLSGWPGPSYLATRDEARARDRLSRRGWQIKGIGPTLPWLGLAGARRRAA
jgi:FkbM family methyltransferase